MTLYVGSNKIKNVSTHGVYVGSQNTNCLTYVPKNINLQLDPLGVNIIGSPTINNGVVSGFSSSNYVAITKTFNPSIYTWKKYLKFKTPSSFSKHTSLSGSSTAQDYQHANFGISSNAHFTCWLSSNGTSWDIAGGTEGTYTVQPNTVYWGSIEFTGSAYIVKYSLNGVDYIQDLTINTTTPVYNGQSTPDMLGFSGTVLTATNWQPANTIYLPDCYYVINGKEVWKGGTGNLTLKAGSKVYVPNGYESYKYYKWVYSAWTQPTLTANGTMGGNSFAVAASSQYDSDHAPWKAFANSEWESTALPSWIAWYNPTRLKISKIAMTNGNNSALRTAVLQGSDDYNTWENIQDISSSAGTVTAWSVDINSKKCYLYHRLYVKSASNNSYVDLRNLTITATQQTGSVESSADDYDYTVGIGQMKFAEVVVVSDYSNTVTTPHKSGMIFPILSGNKCVGFEIYPFNLIESGSSSSLSNTYIWYDTANNLIKVYANGSLIRTDPLPILTFTGNGSNITSINQIFDWCGYIGSTAFVLPGVKGFIPNGWNTDGTYKSIDRTLNNVLIKTPSVNLNTALISNLSSTLESTIWLADSSQDYISPTAYSRYYNTSQNIMRFYGSSGTWSDQSGFMKVADIAITDGKITSLTPATVQPSTTTIPINAIYNGSQLVYQYVPTGKTFNAATYFQTYVVPKGIKKLQVDCVAARGYNGRTAGKGGRVTCILAVTPGQTLYLWVPIDPTTSSEYVYNAADIRTIGGSDIYNADSLNSRLVVAGGGGYSSQDASYGGAGGAGGGLTGANGGDSPAYGGAGGGGTQTAGGAGGSTGGGLGGWSGGAGTFGNGGISNDWKQSGGSGWYGGGGGGASAYYGDGRGGGGGGSSYTHPDLCTNVTHTQGYQDGAGYITITPTK